MDHAGLEALGLSEIPATPSLHLYTCNSELLQGPRLQAVVNWRVKGPVLSSTAPVCWHALGLSSEKLLLIYTSLGQSQV